MEFSLSFESYDCNAEEATQLLPHGGGDLFSMCSARQAHKMAGYMLEYAIGLVRLSCFTIDLTLLIEALKACALRGLSVEVYADHTHSMSGATDMQMDWLILEQGDLLPAPWTTVLSNQIED